jgi:hypothetical protein
MKNQEALERVLLFIFYFADEAQKKYTMSDVSVSGPYLYSDEVGHFLQALAEAGLLPQFEDAWREETARFLTERSLIKTADFAALGRLFSTFVEVEKHTSGFMAEMIDKGVITELLARLAEIRAAVQN